MDHRTIQVPFSLRRWRVSLFLFSTRKKVHIPFQSSQSFSPFISHSIIFITSRQFPLEKVDSHCLLHCFSTLALSTCPQSCRTFGLMLSPPYSSHLSILLLPSASSTSSPHLPPIGSLLPTAADGLHVFMRQCRALTKLNWV